MFRLRVLVFCLVALCARQAPAQEVVKGVSAVGVFDLAEQAALAGHLADALTYYDALSQDPDADIRAEARFRKGQLLAENGRLAEAAVQYRALLDEKPDATAVRLELARILFLAGEERAARRELRQARAAGLPPNVALVVDQFSASLRSQRQFGGNLDVALAPDSNINRATDARTLDTIIAPLTLSDEARRTSGVGLKLGGQAFIRIPVGGRLALVPRASVRADIYRESRFTDVSATALAGLEWTGRQTRIVGSVGETRRWYGGLAYAGTTTVTLDALRPLNAKSQIDGGISLARAVYFANPLQDGLIATASLGYERAFNARSGGRIAGTLVRQTAKDPGFATWSGGVSAVAWREMLGSTMFATIGLTRLVGDERLFLFPEPRREWLMQTSLGATVRKLTVSGFAPVARLRFERNISTVGIYDFRRLTVELGLARAF